MRETLSKILRSIKKHPLYWLLAAIFSTVSWDVVGRSFVEKSSKPMIVLSEWWSASRDLFDNPIFEMASMGVVFWLIYRAVTKTILEDESENENLRDRLNNFRQERHAIGQVIQAELAPIINQSACFSEIFTLDSRITRLSLERDKLKAEVEGFLERAPNGGARTPPMVLLRTLQEHLVGTHASTLNYLCEGMSEPDVDLTLSQEDVRLAVLPVEYESLGDAEREIAKRCVAVFSKLLVCYEDRIATSRASRELAEKQVERLKQELVMANSKDAQDSESLDDFIKEQEGNPDKLEALIMRPNQGSATKSSESNT